MNLYVLSLINTLITGSGDAFSLETEGTVVNVVEKALRGMFYTINTLVYKLVVMLYNMFEAIAKSRLLDSETFSGITTRVGYLLGIIMLFIVIFNFIKILLDPDKMDDKEMGTGAIIKKVLLVIVMLGSSSFVFETLWQFQKYIIEQHVIYNVILPIPPEQRENLNDNFGAILAIRTFTTFYNVEPALQGSVDVSDCEYYHVLLQEEVIKYEDFNRGRFCLTAYAERTDEKNNEVHYFVMDYNYIMQLVLGIILVYILASYVFKVGIRVIQLTILEMISPMAIIGNLSPKKENIYTKWQKMYIGTYIDVFIRLAIIYFVVYISALLLDALAGYTESGQSTFLDSLGPAGEKYKWQIIIVMIFALLSFAKKAPDLIKELFPSGSSKLGLGMGFKDIVGLNKATGMIAGAGVGAAIGLVGGIAGGKGFSRITGAFGGVLGGAARGVGAGAKSKGVISAMSTARTNQATYNSRRAEAIAGGSTFLGRNWATLQKSIGIETTGDKDNRALETLNKYEKMQSTIEDYAENNPEVKRLKRDYEAIQQAGRKRNESDKEFTNRVEAARKTYKNALEATINAALTGRDQTWDRMKIDTSGNIVVDVNETMDVTSINTNITSSIRAGVSELNREMNNNKSLFPKGTGPDDYKTVSSFKTMDDNSNRARRDAAELTSTSQYARGQANNKFSTKK